MFKSEYAWFGVVGVVFIICFFVTMNLSGYKKTDDNFKLQYIEKQIIFEKIKLEQLRQKK